MATHIIPLGTEDRLALLSRIPQDPTQNPQTVLDDCASYWADPARAATVCTLVRHQGSLLYPDPNSLDFTFKVTMEQAAKVCAQNGNQPCANPG
ncbi:MAG: hypothetical protein ACR2F9_03880 [Longimicrobiaceae bacterium]